MWTLLDKMCTASQSGATNNYEQIPFVAIQEVGTQRGRSLAPVDRTLADRGSLHKLITSAVDGVPRDQLVEPSHTLDISNKNNVKAFFVATSIAMGLSYSLECDEGLP